jgi:hypothetical protein
MNDESQDRWLTSFQAVFHAGLGATADEDVGQVANLSYKPISRAAIHTIGDRYESDNTTQ